METSGRTCTYSFGDDGLTATASPSGRLLRISRHFRGERFGYCVDHWSIPEPYEVVDRITSFLSSADDPDHNIGFYPDQGSWVFDAKKVTADFINDRWPNFDIHGERETCKIQYSVSDGAVYQTFDFSNSCPPMAFMPGLLLRQLQFTHHNNGFNKARNNNTEYRTHLLNEGKCIRRSHALDQGHNKYVTLSVYAFSGDVALTFEEFQENEDIASKEVPEVGKQGEEEEDEQYEGMYEGSSEETEEEEDDKGEDDAEITYYKLTDDDDVSGLTKITFVYVLSLETDELEAFSKPPEFTAAPDVGRTDTSKERNFTSNPKLNIALRRNLEYILSVCSIPVYPDATDDKEFAIALTCGDIDSHRVASAASFYCFQFLLMALRHFTLSLEHDEHYDFESASCDSCCIIKRIRRTLEGHLRWVFEGKYRNLASRPSCLHTWVNGDEIMGLRWSRDLSSDSLADVPFQLIKAGNYKEYDSEWEVPEAAKSAVKAWLEELDPMNKLGCYAFPRYILDSVHTFYLTDHVLIWRAAKCVDLLGLRSRLSVSVPQEEDRNKKKTQIREYFPSRIQNQILKRFTVENPVSKKRMLSVFRSPGHVRFLLRTEDTLLFHAMESELFDKPGANVTGDGWQNKIDIWKGLVDCQPLHDDNDDTSWEEPLRFALSLIMAYKGKAMNSRSPREMHKRSMDVLLESSWGNGLFPGQLDVDGEPAIYSYESNRDRYWGNSFEIPCLLWKYGEYPSEAKPARGLTVTEPELDFKPLRPQDALPEYQMNTSGVNYASIGPMKRIFPWNSPVDQTNVVELSDEWLYNVPDFFKKEIRYDPSDTVGALYSFMYRMGNRRDNRDRSKSGLPFKGAVVDVPRSKAGKKTPLELDKMLTYVCDSDKLMNLMRAPRIPCKAKKRLCVLFATDPEANMPYPQHHTETRAIDNFYQRHKSYDKHFSEHTAAKTNRWTTELHFSFNALVRQPLEIKSQRSSTREETICQEKGLEAFVSLIEDVGYSGSRKVAMSMRFDGDFFDRYWTCHMLDCTSVRVTDETDVKLAIQRMLYNEGEEGEEGKVRFGSEKKSWRKRRVLELLLFQAMVDRMYNRTDEILEDSESIAKEEDTFWIDFNFESNASDYDAFRRNINLCQERLRQHQQRLQTVEQDIAENFVHINHWLKREQLRQTERPRWTFNDEIKYRGIISKLFIQNDRTIQDLGRCQPRLRVLIEKLSRMLQELDRKLERQDRELEKQDRLREANRNADIQRFTYVTVIFLPLGFTTGVFSTSGAPSGTTLRSMALTAIGAFVMTGILIACATNLEMVKKSFRKFKDLAVFRKAGGTWKGIKLARGKPSDQEEGSQHIVEEMRHGERGSRSEVRSESSGGGSWSSESGSWSTGSTGGSGRESSDSEGNGQREGRGSDSMV